MTLQFQLSNTPLDIPALLAEMENREAGGVVTFEGRVRRRNQGREVVALEYEAYPEMAEREGLRILEEATEQWPVLQVTTVHRTGRLEIGESAVWIGVASPHRAEAFAACRYIIDTLKVRVPIWKKEHYVDGSSEWIQSGG